MDEQGQPEDIVANSSDYGERLHGTVGEFLDVGEKLDETEVTVYGVIAWLEEALGYKQRTFP